MAIPFSRSLYTLRADRYIVPVILIVAVVILILLWIGWLLFGSIPDYKEGTDLVYSKDGVIYAQFPYESRAELRPGQETIIYFNDESTQQQTEIPAVVYEVSFDKEDDTVSLFVSSVESIIQDRITGPSTRARVLVRSYSPIEYMLSRSNSQQASASDRK